MKRHILWQNVIEKNFTRLHLSLLPLLPCFMRSRHCHLSPIVNSHHNCLIEAKRKRQPKQDDRQTQRSQKPQESKNQTKFSVARLDHQTHYRKQRHSLKLKNIVAAKLLAPVLGNTMTRKMFPGRYINGDKGSPTSIPSPYQETNFKRGSS